MGTRHDYAQLLSPCLGRATAYARSIVRDQHDADDAVQQASIRGLERFGTFDSSRSFKSWWFAILRNCCIDMLRAAKTTRTEALGEHDAPAPAAAEGSEWQRLSESMDRLSEEHREVLRLKYFADQSYREIAQTLAIPQGTVMSRLYLARKALAENMKDEDI
jgi:RNA polymerase sigma-70 factor (ECF subfamily)